MTPTQQAIIDRLKEAFYNAEDFIDCKKCIHYEKYWNCGQGDGVCSQCVMKDDGVYYEEDGE